MRILMPEKNEIVIKKTHEKKPSPTSYLSLSRDFSDLILKAKDKAAFEKVAKFIYYAQKVIASEPEKLPEKFNTTTCNENLTITFTGSIENAILLLKKNHFISKELYSDVFSRLTTEEHSVEITQASQPFSVLGWLWRLTGEESRYTPLTELDDSNHSKLN